MSSGDERGPSIGRRRGRATTHQAEAYGTELGGAVPHADMEPDATGIASEEDAFRQPTAMFDRGELIGELADAVEDPVVDTRAAVETEHPPRGFKLIVVAGPDIGSEWAYKQNEITIGRSGENELDLPDISVSRRHARISLEEMQFFLTDLNSDNGTLLNGVRIQREPLCSGDEILVGARTLRFVELDEAPPTAAAHAVAVRQEPASGRASEIVFAHEVLGLGGASQVDVGIVPEADGPSAGSRVDMPAAAGSKPNRAPRTLLKLIAGLVLLTVALGALSAAGVHAWRRITGDDPHAREQKARREFLEGIALMKKLRCGDAIVLFDSVLVARPEYTRAKEYKAHCEREVAVYETVEAARKLAREGRQEEALLALARVPTDSSYAPEAERLRTAFARASAERKVEDARGRLAAGEVEGAFRAVSDIVLSHPDIQAARVLRDRIDGIRRPEPGPRQARSGRPSAKPPIPPLLERSIRLYLGGDVDAAIDAAASVGGPDGTQIAETLARVRALAEEIAGAHTKKAAGEILRLAPESLELDEKVSRGAGVIRERLRGHYADGLYLRGLEAHQNGDYGAAYRLFSESIRQRPGHKLSVAQLAALGLRARDLFYRGYAEKDTNREETERQLRQVVEMTAPDDPFHKRAVAWLAANRGP